MKVVIQSSYFTPNSQARPKLTNSRYTIPALALPCGSPQNEAFPYHIHAPRPVSEHTNPILLCLVHPLRTKPAPAISTVSGLTLAPKSQLTHQCYHVTSLDLRLPMSHLHTGRPRPNLAAPIVVVHSSHAASVEVSKLDVYPRHMSNESSHA